MQASQVNALALLDAEVSDAVNRLLRRISDRVASIDDRIHVCQTKLIAVTQHNKPTTCFFTSTKGTPRKR